MNKNSILIVEDEIKLNQFLCEYMEIYFDVVYSAFNGDDGLEIYKKNKPDVIFTDIQMSKLNGLEFAEKIRENDKDTIIVILSAFTEKEKLFKAIELQLLTYLVKPIKSDELKQTILNIKKQLKSRDIINLSETTEYHLSTSTLVKGNKEIELTLYEKKFLNLLFQRKGICVSYEDISMYVYDLDDFSKDSITSLVKRLRKKLDKNIILNCFNEGYKLQIIS